MDHSDELGVAYTGSGSAPGTGAGSVPFFCLSLTLALCFLAFSENSK